VTLTELRRLRPDVSDGAAYDDIFREMGRYFEALEKYLEEASARDAGTSDEMVEAIAFLTDPNGP
jgi:hypothetical protein